MVEKIVADPSVTRKSSKHCSIMVKRFKSMSKICLNRCIFIQIFRPLLKTVIMIMDWLKETIYKSVIRLNNKKYEPYTQRFIISSMWYIFPLNFPGFMYKQPFIFSDNSFKAEVHDMKTDLFLEELERGRVVHEPTFKVNFCIFLTCSNIQICFEMYESEDDDIKVVLFREYLFVLCKLCET